MKKCLRAAVIALTSTLLIFAASCNGTGEQAPSDVCGYAKFLKDSTIKAGYDVYANVEE
ncbi:MAG: hypothetical protein II075_12990 [Bacteroidales bacterium]|nr:hypothetical protein [Bacteroidales bacterium]